MINCLLNAGLTRKLLAASPLQNKQLGYTMNYWVSHYPLYLTQLWTALSKWTTTHAKLSLEPLIKCLWPQFISSPNSYSSPNIHKYNCRWRNGGMEDGGIFIFKIKCNFYATLLWSPWQKSHFYPILNGDAIDEAVATSGKALNWLLQGLLYESDPR